MITGVCKHEFGFSGYCLKCGYLNLREGVNKSICPICKKDKNVPDKSINFDKLKTFKIISEHCNPGGRELIVKKGNREIRIQLYDQCVNCDLNKLINKLGLRDD